MTRKSKNKRGKKAAHIDSSKSTAAGDLARWKIVSFSILVPVLFFAILEGLLTIAGVEVTRYESDPYVGFSSTAPLFQEARLADGSAVLRTVPNKFTLFNAMQFPRDKSAGTFRIFCTGGSTTYGRPYTNNTSFCGWLRQFLAALDSTRRWEVINAGGISYASYRVALLTEELIDYEPDLFIVYSGHNEFLEKRTYGELIAMPRSIHGLTAWLRSTRIYSVLERMLDGFRSPPDGDTSTDDGLLAAEVRPLLDSSIGPDAYTRDDDLRDQVLRHYRFNLARTIDIASSVGAASILVTPASNLRNTTPFKSEHRSGLDMAEQKQQQELIQSATLALDADNPVEALPLLDQALSIDDRYAHAWFLKGRALEQLGQFEEARTAYEKARDEDIVPLRALSSMDDIVKEVAGDRDVPLIDFVQLVDQRSPNQLPGESLFLDHVHPTIEANRLLALALVDQMRRMGIVRIAVTSPADVIEQVTRQVLTGLNRRSHAEAMNNLSKVQAWAGQL
ncbi:MAG: tetratricopeptide repeat protein, partial [Gammaproteobacteria bacterium]